ncbi:hypothetical protein C3F09_07575 [candidate division GN15 bacterium]|uniref:FlgD/Vpr Ig-like domain-containing protein n=1 Tax=candidate division GN15 bacterium TaxID=2072418 RepID=A0A855X643_9BACT|nr:MAG: hypothetical protein C3F09_07575 [candidate division GN15 bacterium]
MKVAAVRSISYKTRQITAAAAVIVMLVALPALSAEPQSATSPNASVSTIILSISPNQVVGHPLQTSATILLLDSANNLVTGYDLAANPIVLSVGSGVLTPATLNDPSLDSGGVIKFLAAQCTYLGPTGKIPVIASNGLVSSEPVIVSFSGYDILKVTDFKGDSIVEVYQGLPTTVKVTATNRGGLVASSNPSMRSYFKAGGGSVQAFFAGHKDGFVDTVSMIDTAFVPVIVDTLIVLLNAHYLIGSTDFLTVDTVKLPVFVRTPATVTFASGSLEPDSVYANENFSLGFQVLTTGFSGPIDSTRVRLELAPGVPDPSVAVVYTGSPTYSSFIGGVITYSGLGAKVVPLNGLPPGWYTVRAIYHLFSGASEFILNGVPADSLYIIPRSGPEYIAGSFAPDTVAAGAEASFQFGLQFADGANLEVEPGSGIFTILGTGFEATVNLMIPGDTLVSGSNLVTTENVFIPANQLGKTLTVSAELHYRRFGSPTYLTFSTTFDTQMVQVQQFPLVQIVSLDCVAPNGNKVNINQPFQMHARIANISESPAENLVFRLTSDGNSIDSLLKTIVEIPPLDTYDLYYDVVASSIANPAEIFSVNFVSGNAGRIPPVDNIALVAIQTPATLVLTHTVVGAPNGYVRQGAAFSLVVDMTNLGLAEVSPGEYRLSTGGLDLGLSPDDTLGEITTESARNFAFHAPIFDTTVTITFTVTQIPLDLNINAPAVFQKTSLSFAITVASIDARLVVSSETTVDRPLTQGVPTPVFTLRLDNSSVSTANLMQLDSIVLLFSNRSGSRANVNSVIVVSVSGMYEDGQRVSAETAHADSLTLRFSNVQIGPLEERQLSFVAAARDGADGNLAVALDSAGVFASYVTGPSAGSRVVTGPAEPGQPIVEIVSATGGLSLEGSFMVENNPWHQETSPARFAYVLEQSAGLEFRIFTLTGELVHKQDIDQNSSLGQAGSHVLEWDGRNDRGKIVFDGVYIVQLTNTVSGERARLKLAVLK